jgi:hypothetical protein
MCLRFSLRAPPVAVIMHGLLHIPVVSLGKDNIDHHYTVYREKLNVDCHENVGRIYMQYEIMALPIYTFANTKYTWVDLLCM